VTAANARTRGLTPAGARVRMMLPERQGDPIAAALVAVQPDFVGLSRLLVEQDYVLMARSRPILARDGRVTVRLVWRRRRDGAATVVQQPLQGALPPELQDALAASFRF
jgi:hypothetical protein